MSNAREIISEYDHQIWLQQVAKDEREAACRNATALYNKFRIYMKKPGFKGTKELEEELNKVAVEKCTRK